MEKTGTPEMKGDCSNCGERKTVVPVETGTTKVASASKQNHSNIEYICTDCLGE